MQRIAVVGCGGAGKSHVAKELGRLLDLPVHHLDETYYDADWNPLPKEEFEAAQRELVSASRWVIDGNYNSTLPVRLAAADTVIFADPPSGSCLWGVLSRQVRHGAGQHGDGLHNRITWGFLRYIARYRREMRPKVLAQIQQHPHVELITLTSRRATRRFLRALAAPSAAAGAVPSAALPHR